MAVDFFSYTYGKTFFHKIPAQIKLFLMIVFCVFVFLPDELFVFNLFDNSNEIEIEFIVFRSFFVFCANKNIPIIKFVISLIVCVFSFFLSGRNVKSFAPLKYILFVGLLTTWGNGIKHGALYTLKFLFTAHLSQIVFMTTSSLQMKAAIEDCQNFVAKIIPPKKIKNFIKEKNAALLVFLAISFIPQIFAVWNEVNLAARARGSTNKKQFCRFVPNTLAQFQALFSCMLYKAETKRKALINRTPN